MRAPSHPLPLIVDLHGYSETAGYKPTSPCLAATGPPMASSLLHPRSMKQVQHWVTSPGSSDQRFLIALIGHVASTICVDSHRVYVAGYSNGAFMASALACTDASKIAAVATVAGIEAPTGCHPARRVPVIAFHGTADPFVPYKGGIGPAPRSCPQ